MKILTIISNSGTVPVIKTSHYIQQLTNIPKVSTYQLASHANCLGTSVKNMTVIMFFLYRRCFFKHQVLKKEISLTFLMMASILSNCQILKVVHGHNISVTPFQSLQLSLCQSYQSHCQSYSYWQIQTKALPQGRFFMSMWFIPY